MCIAGKMRVAYNQRGEQLLKEKLRGSVSHPGFAKNQVKIYRIL